VAQDLESQGFEANVIETNKTFNILREAGLRVEPGGSGKKFV
jgi:hypothetical protein